MKKEEWITLIIITATIVNFFIPDPLPFIDEMGLTILSVYRIVK